MLFSDATFRVSFKVGTAVAVFLLAQPRETQAEVVYSNLGAGDTFDQTAGLIVNQGQYPADAFTPTFDAVLNSIEVAVFTSVQPSALVNVTLLLNDPSLNRPLAGSGIPLGTLSAPNNGTGALVTLMTPSIQLLSGVTYWLQLEPNQGSFAGWNFANNRSANPVAISSDGGNTYHDPGPPSASAFRVSGTPVPEPSILGMLVIGSLISAAGIIRSKVCDDSQA